MNQTEQYRHRRYVALGLWLLCLTTVHVAADTALEVPPAAVTWQLQTAGDYQVVANETLATLLEAAPTLCESPRPDGRFQLWADAEGHEHRVQFSNEQGVLRWWSNTVPPQQIWSERDKQPLVTEQLSDQLAVIAQPTSPKRLQVVWHEPQAKRYSAVDLTTPFAPKALWQWQPTGVGTVQTPVAATFKTATGTATTLLMVSGAMAVQPTLWLVDADSGHPLATAQYHASKKTVELPFVLQDLIAAPATLDRNADGYADRIYLVDVQGRLLQVDVDEQLQLHSRVVADLSDAGAQFDVQLVASRALLPDYQQQAGATEHAMAKQPQLLAAGTTGRPADVVLLLSVKNQQSQLWALTIPDSPAFTIQPHHLVVRNLQQQESDLAVLNSTTVGWYGTLPAAPVSLPQVFAGVIYLPLAAQSQSCVGARQADQLIALHVFQGSHVYPQPQMSAIPTPFGLPGAVQRSSGELALQDLFSGTILLPQLQGIRVDCGFCTEALAQQLYPQWRRMAIYQHESEIY